MILNATCPHCGALLDVTPEWLGQPLECGGCAGVFDCPALAQEAPPDDAPQVLREKESRRRRTRERNDDRWDGYDDYNQSDDPDSYTAKKRGPGFATASLVLGIVALTVGSLFTLGCCGFVQTILSVIGMVLGYIGLRSDARGNAIAGMVMNVLAALISVAYMSFIGVMFSMKSLWAPPPPPPATTTKMVTATTWQGNPPPAKAKW